VKIGVPKEIKVLENRVSLTPAGVERLVQAGHELLVQSGAGTGSGLVDEAYATAGARLIDDAQVVWGEADLILKVKEPLQEEWPRMRSGQTLFTYLHLAADRSLTEALVSSGIHGFAYETLEVDGHLPLLTPMSEVAGRMAIQAGAKYLESHHGGVGVLLGGVPGVRRAQVVILGGGVVGMNAARMAAGMGADVTILDVNLDRLRYLDEILPANCRTIYSTPMAVREAIQEADLVIGAVLIPGAAAPCLVRREDLSIMRKGAVIVDVAVDQGGCIETCHPTTHAAPTYEIDGVIHYCVANMPGAVPRTSTFALTHATLPWTLKLADLGPVRAVLEDEHLPSSANTFGGYLTCGAVAGAFDMEWRPSREVAVEM
jgi:alanine dehydrogenase